MKMLQQFLKTKIGRELCVELMKSKDLKTYVKFNAAFADYIKENAK